MAVHLLNAEPTKSESKREKIWSDIFFLLHDLKKYSLRDWISESLYEDSLKFSMKMLTSAFVKAKGHKGGQALGQIKVKAPCDETEYELGEGQGWWQVIDRKTLRCAGSSSLAKVLDRKFPSFTFYSNTLLIAQKDFSPSPSS